MFAAIERIRAQLAEHVKAPIAVSAKRMQWAFSEDSEAWCDIDVRDLAADRFVLVVVADSSANPQRGELLTRVWHYYCPEVWIVDSEARSISVRVRDEPAYVAASSIVPTKLPSVTIDTRELFSDD